MVGECETLIRTCVEHRVTAEHVHELLLGELREAVRREVIRQLAEGSVELILDKCEKGLAETTKQMESAVASEEIGQLVQEETERVLTESGPVEGAAVGDSSLPDLSAAGNSSLPDLSESRVRRSVIR